MGSRDWGDTGLVIEFMVPVRRLGCIAAAASALIDEGRTGNLPLPDLGVGTVLYFGAIIDVGEIVVAVRGEIGLLTLASPVPECHALFTG